MKFTLISLFALVSVALAVGQGEHNEFAKRQSDTVPTNVPANSAAMTDKNGNVLPFDSANVYLAAAASGI